MSSLVWKFMGKEEKKKNKKKKARSISTPTSRSGSSSSEPPYESISFIFTTMYSSPSGVKFHRLTLPCDELMWLTQVDVKRHAIHDHLCGDRIRFRRLNDTLQPDFLALSPLEPSCSPAVIDSTIYYLFCDYDRQNDRDLTKVTVYEDGQLQFFSYDIDSNNHHYPQFVTLPPPAHPNRLYPKCFSLRGKVFLFGGLSRYHDAPLQPYGESFDPDTGLWSPIQQPPNARELINRFCFVASLGERLGKFIVFDHETPSQLYYYDVEKDEWRLKSINSNAFYPHYICGKPTMNDVDGNLYWLDEREGHIFAMDLKTMKTSSGPIVGLENISLFTELPRIGSSDRLSLNHLWKNYFCLIWSVQINTVSGIRPLEYHYTFLKVVKQPHNGSLVAYALGCFVDTFYDDSQIHDIIVCKE